MLIMQTEKLKALVVLRIFSKYCRFIAAININNMKITTNLSLPYTVEPRITGDAGQQ